MDKKITKLPSPTTLANIGYKEKDNYFSIMEEMILIYIILF